MPHLRQKIWLVTFVFLGCSLPVFCQRGYIIQKESVSHNIKLKDQGQELNGLTCILITKGSQTVYTPELVVQYGFGAAVYQSAQILFNGESKRVFLLRLFRGNVSLYSFVSGGRERFFIARGDTTDLGEFSRELLTRFVSECSQAVENVRYVTSSRGPLLRFVRNYQPCSDRPFSRLRYGLLIGGASTSLKTASITGALFAVKLPVNRSITVGTFLDNPIGAGPFSFHPELLYRRNALAFAFKGQESDYDLVVNTSTVSAPLMIQYLLPGIRKRVFIEGGVVYARTLRNESSLFQYQFTGNSFMTEIDNRLLVPRNQFAYSFGAGMRLDTKRNYWLLEFRHTGLFGFSHKVDQTNIAEFTISLGRTF